MDKLIVEGLARLDGEYTFDVVELLSLGLPGSLTSREAHRIKVMSGVTITGLQDALQAGDNDVLLAIAAIVLSRHGKTFDEDALWDSPIGSAMLVVAERPADEDSDVDPQTEPVLPPPSDGPSTNGGESSKPTLENQGSDLSATGLPASLRSVTSDPEILAS